MDREVVKIVLETKLDTTTVGQVEVASKVLLPRRALSPPVLPCFWSMHGPGTSITTCSPAVVIAGSAMRICCALCCAPCTVLTEILPPVAP
eukprot:128339-Rhodomonas_salina.5